MDYLRFLFIFLFASFSFTVLSQDISQDPEIISQGEEIFLNNCKSCHRIKTKFVGPAMAGVEERAPSIDWIKGWIRNSAKMIAEGDEYGVQLYEEYNRSPMTAFTSYTDEQIMSILAYVKAEAEKEEPVVAQTSGDGSAQTDQMITEHLQIIMVGVLVILVTLVIILVLITSKLKQYVLIQKLTPEAQSDVITSPYSWSTIIRSPGVIFIVAFIAFSVGGKTIIDGLFSIGVQKDYQPTQPIAFSHKIHAGQYEIDCQYCHTGASKGKQANIPSANVCMNCHKQIQTGTFTGETEIAKIHEAVGYDVSTASYTGETKPIEWVRIHNLPDLSYFNHAQHVQVGDIECQTCHGPVEEMEVVKQHALLTMGWCVDCHRKTPVKTEKNEYYMKLAQQHEQINGKNIKMKVEDIGGLECARCHY